MKVRPTLLILVLTFIVPMLTSFSAKASSESELDGRCMGGRNAKACYELAMIHYKKGERPAAARYFKIGCTAEKAKKCSKTELKQIAKNFAASDRVPASKKK